MSDDLRERQAAYRDWLDRERQRAALAGAACMTCVHFDENRKAPDVDGYCHHSTNSQPSTLVVKQWWCEHYLPRAEHDPRPEGGTP